ncbi:hypothetical protein AAFF_G00237460 [Aldrovandia affinis]|uniref:Uncharacterized protein n=1 Tax=Aldrovandia affinis TaxID=143900 RepID=A0AAD7W4L5_9TELE|nr:hypothetical protein AAFF_G00237460 [Aldrovandia affinis]
MALSGFSSRRLLRITASQHRDSDLPCRRITSPRLGTLKRTRQPRWLPTQAAWRRRDARGLTSADSERRTSPPPERASPLAATDAHNGRQSPRFPRASGPNAIASAFSILKTGLQTLRMISALEVEKPVLGASRAG